MIEGNVQKKISFAYRSVQQNSSWWLDANRLEERRMTQWQLDHLLDLRQLLATSTDVIVTDCVQSFLLFLQRRRLSLKFGVQ